MVVLQLFVACGAPEPDVSPPAPAAAPVVSTPSAPSVERTAKVVEVKQSGGYTYARLDACGQEAWAAGPTTELVVGSTVTMPEGLVMTNFEAPSLGRTFETILFVDYFHPTQSELTCNAAPPPPAAAPAAGLIVGRVVETMEAGGYTYLSLDTCGVVQWVAGPRTPVGVGEWVEVNNGFVTANFRSPSLGRTFDQLRMVDRITKGATAPACSGS